MPCINEKSTGCSFQRQTILYYFFFIYMNYDLNEFEYLQIGTVSYSLIFLQKSFDNKTRKAIEVFIFWLACQHRCHQ